MMDDFVNIFDIIDNKRENFTKKQHEIADYIRKHGDTICFLSLREFSEICDVSPVTILKFSHTLGFKNFVEMKKSMQNYLETIINQEKKISFASINLDRKELIDQIFKYELLNLKQTLENTCSEKLMEISLDIISARKVYITAFGYVLPIAKHFQLRLQGYNIHAELLLADNIDVLTTQIGFMEENDLLIAFSFPNYSSYVVNIIDAAKLRNCKLITFTDNAVVPAAVKADSSLICMDSGVVIYNSMTTTISMITIISSILAMELNEELKTKREVTKDIINKLSLNQTKEKTNGR